MPNVSRTNIRIFRRLLLSLCAFATIFIPRLTPRAYSQTYSVLYRFAGTPDGQSPNPGVARDPAGNLYGTTSEGGNANCFEGCGVIFRVDTAGKETVLYRFTGGPDGAKPYSGLVRDPAGNLYGTTAGDAAAPYGTVFRLSPTGELRILHTFQNSEGAFPTGLVLDTAANLYGTAATGGPSSQTQDPGCGSVFKIDPSGNLTVLYGFTCGSDGEFPVSPLVLDGAGNIYGTAFTTVFKLDPSGNLVVLYNPDTGLDGGNVTSGLVRDKAGNLYGTTSFGGDTDCDFGNGCGVVFKVDPAGKGGTVLYSFTGDQDGLLFPQQGVLRDGAGNLYGSTLGTLFKLDPAGSLATLYTFTGGADGNFPGGPFDIPAPQPLTWDKAGNLYGTAAQAGSFPSACILSTGANVGCGVVFKLSLVPTTTLNLRAISSSPQPMHSDPLTYSFQVWNTGEKPADYEVLTTQAPAGTTFSSLEMVGTDGLATCSHPGIGFSGPVICLENSKMKPHSTWTVNLTVTVTAQSQANITETATASSDNSAPQTTTLISTVH